MESQATDTGGNHCYDCLQRRIAADFSDRLIFRYGLSDSALPFASKAVVQIDLNNKSNINDSSAQLVLIESANGDGIPSLWPIARSGPASYAAVERIVGEFLSGSVEDAVVSSLNLLMEGKPSGSDGPDFLRLIGLPEEEAAADCPRRVRHPNIVPVLAVLDAKGHSNLLHPKPPFTLENVLNYSPKALKSEWHIRFLIYQMISAIAHVHDLGLSHGNICPSELFLSDSCWVWLSIPGNPFKKPDFCGTSDCVSRALYADLKLSWSDDWRVCFKRWWAGELSNYEYLLLLNKLAGRRWGDHTFHIVMPWVIDFTVNPDEGSDAGWRDLSKSKWRLAKGDEQLDFTYSTSEVPHHVSDECLSELAVCSYKARRLPLSVLRSAVRSVYEPNEYPSSMQRLYQWTPDECIPEFYSNPLVFESIHPGMSDLAIPNWAGSPEEFVKLHREALESDRVSRQIHHWIDITFGYKLSGLASVEAKNVFLPSSDHTVPKSSGRRQLFMRPHPVRRGFALDASCLEEFEAADKFCEHARYLSPLYRYRDPVADDSTAEILREQPKCEAVEKSDQVLPVLSHVDLSCLLECMEAEEECSSGFQELLLWRQKLRGSFSEGFSEDVFSMGCVIAELYLKRPLFDSVSLAAYRDKGILPGMVEQLPPQVALLVKEAIQKEWRSTWTALRRGGHISTCGRTYRYVRPQTSTNGSHLQYAARLASAGALKGSDYSHLKIFLLQDSFVREIWNRLGKQAYLETMHQLVISNLYTAPHKISASAASVLLIGSSEELGGLLGENFIVRHLLPLLRSVVLSCVEDQICIPVSVLLQTRIDLPVIQVAATTLVTVCQRIGPDFTASHVLPQLRELFDELAFSQEETLKPGSLGRNLKVSRVKFDEAESHIESRMDLVLLLYPFFASLIGIEKLRQCCTTWFLLEQYLQRVHSWKWEYTGESSKSVSYDKDQRPGYGKISASEYNPAKLLLNGVGWSIPQSQGARGGKITMNSKKLDVPQEGANTDYTVTSSFTKSDPWFWFPSSVASWDGSEFLGRTMGPKDEIPWKIRASILYSVRAHPGALRCMAVCHDESTIFTGGVGPGFKGTIQKWELQRANCISGYYGHDEVVNHILILSASGRVASCDGTIHLWNSHSGKLISAYAEQTNNYSQSSTRTVYKGNMDPDNLSGGILSSAFNGNLYTCMHYLETENKLIAGMGNGSLRFIDIVHDRKLHICKSDGGEHTLSSLVSAICSCGSEKLREERGASSSSWIAAGLSSGHCRLLDARSGDVIALWRAHDAHITKQLAAPEDHLLVSSSLDKTLRVWDLRRNLSSQTNVFRGHKDGISSFDVWGQDD
ncbi:hypothetical protein QJS10_CPA05g00123 [Acorus calamus]|uniref:BEACH domain-containing protein n=1 Tax=Acorus calamus TaxID=4465 RepID=A0AAV9ER81_ACOCL|nr:hypothetical protein QJS10_CPA05g00123 [Acorus calamus]